MGEITHLVDQVDVQALVERASTLKNDIGCTFKPSKYNDTMMGNANYHAWLNFDDGEQWLIRIPRQVFSDVPNAFVFYAAARSKSEMFAPNDTATPETPQEFFLKHVDDKGDQILINDQGIITGLIDWQFARFARAMEAFGASYLTANLDWLYSRDAGVTGNDRRLAEELRQRGRGDLACYMEGHELARRFHHGLSEGLVRSEAREVLEAWRKTLGEDITLDLDSWIDKICNKNRRWERVKTLNSIESHIVSSGCFFQRRVSQPSESDQNAACRPLWHICPGTSRWK